MPPTTELNEVEFIPAEGIIPLRSSQTLYRLVDSMFDSIQAVVRSDSVNNRNSRLLVTWNGSVRPEDWESLERHLLAMADPAIAS